MKRAIPEVGYLHRSIEKIGERCTYNGFMPYTDRVDYIAAMFANQGWAIAVERLLGLQVPRRAEFCRVIACELNRIASHLISVGTMAMDIGAVTPFPYALREREFINDLLEELCGARLTYNYLRIGGVAFDLPSGYEDKVSAFLDHFEKILDEFNRLITYNEIFIKRLAHLAPIPAQMAIDYCLVGPNLRASGVSFDVRKALPYSVYPDFQFDVPVGKGEVGTPGDAWDRFWCRVEEMRQSCRILRQALAQLPKDTAIMGKVPRKIKIPEGTEAYSRIESARGDMQYYVVAGPGENAHRVKIRTGSFTAMGIIDALSRGLMIADPVKLLFKEDLIPAEADNVLFRAAPYFMMVGFACVFVALPFSHRLIVADMNIGIFYILAVTALIVVGIIMSGWSSNSKWSLFGAIRSAAQIISYEIPAGMALMIPVLLAGTMSTQGIIRAQGPWPWQWFIFDNPAATAGFFIFFISALAEGNRTPFDLPEAESELVSGYNTEYSGMRFSYFFLVEWGNLWVMSALAVTMFMGGWQVPFLPAERLDALTGWVAFFAEVASVMIFALKTLFFVFVVMWLRWTLPRIRVDQMMNMCWKYLVPISFAGVLFVAVWMLVVHSVPMLGVAMRVLLTAFGAFGVGAFVVRTLKNIRDTGDKFDFTSNW